MTTSKRRPWGGIGAALLIALATPALGGGGGHHGHGRHNQDYNIVGAPAAPGVSAASGTPGVAVPVAASAPGVTGAAVPAPAAVVPPPADDPVACEHPASAEQDRLCLQRRAAEAAERSAMWAERTYFIGVALVLGLLAAMVVAYFTIRRGRRSPGA